MAANLTPRRPHFLSSWFPATSASTLRGDFDNFLESFFGNGGEIVEPHIPPIDLAETNESVEVRMNVPGIKAENIDIDVNGNLLTISGKTEEEKEEKGKTYHRTERRVGHFMRRINLPCAVKEENVKAVCRDGVLSVNLPKCADAKSKKIKVAGG